MGSPYQKLVIFYFSGTGNARQTALWIADEAEKNGIETKVENIEKINIAALPDSRENLLIGFCSPTHGFNLPPVMLKFLWKFPKGPGADAFIINTRAGMKMGKLFLPGLGGMAQYFAAVVLRLKGYKIVGMQPMDLPSNWISIHPGLREKVVNSIFQRCDRISRSFTRKIVSGKRVYKALHSLPFDLAVFPIAILYFIIGRFAIAKTFIATSACTECGLCEKQCPVHAIKMIRNRPYWTFSCESCMRCMNNCPERAIQTSHSFTIAFWWLIFSFMLPWALSKLQYFDFFGEKTFGSVSNFIADLITWFFGLILIYIAYELTHYLLRFRIFDNLVAYTSFTKYTFWRRYRPAKKQSKK
jgi:Pyruvate/2-oxoacid:ferredoxin oxidoreductase delta subunit